MNKSIDLEKKNSYNFLCMNNFRYVIVLLLIILSFSPSCRSTKEADHGYGKNSDVPFWEPDSAPEELKNAFSQARLEFIPGKSSFDIPVRIFGEDGEKTPVIMSHGLQSHSGWFAQSAAFMARLGFPVYSLDRRGSGLSQAPRGDLKDFKDMIEDIHFIALEAMKRHEKDKVLILGHCFGAIPATAYSCSYPETVKALLMTTPAIYTKTSVPFYDKLRIIGTRPGRRDFMVPVSIDSSLFTELKEYEEFIIHDHLALRQATGDFYYQVHRARQFIYKNTAQLVMPVFMAIAAQDPICDNRGNKNFFHRLPSEHKTLIEYKEARHILEFSSDKEKYFKDLANWLKHIEDK